MKHFLALTGALLVSTTAAFSASDTAPPASFRAGVASATVNPPEGVYLGGNEYNRKSTTVHDNLYAKAIVWDDGKTPLALVVVDALSLQYEPTVKALRAAASEKTKTLRLPPERIIVQATHTHCAPDTIGIYGPDATTCGRSEAYMKQLVDTASEQVARAAANLQPATLAYAETECTGWAVNDSEPSLLDNSVTILICRNAQGQPIATLTNFACHPTVLDENTPQISADWVGSFYKKMGEVLPAEHLFLQGGVGGWIQPETPERTFTLAEKYGNDLAAKVLTALEHAKPVEGTEIRFAHNVFSMPCTSPTFKQMTELNLVARNMAGESLETDVAWFALGNAQFATHPGETAPEYTRETKALMKTGPRFVLGLALDHLGYILPTRFFDNTKDIKFAEYLTSMSPGRGAGASMMAALNETIPAEK